jgi:predicted Zn-dependent protease
MKIDKILAITLISLLVMSVGTVNADVFYTLKLKQEQRPSVCMFEPSPETTDNWELLKVATMMGIYEWEIKLSEAYPDGDWKIDVHQTIPWEEHEHKFATDYKQCNIMINFEKTNNIENSNAIGTTSIQFQNSNHKYMFINIYLEHPTTSKNVKIVIGGDTTGTFTVETKNIILSPKAVRNVVLHEMGHAFGLEHYDITTPLKPDEHGTDRSSMYYSINLSDTQQSLEVKRPEILMLKEIYGEDGWLGTEPAWNIRSCTVINTILYGCK